MSEMNKLAKQFLSQKGKTHLEEGRAVTPPSSFRALFDYKEMSQEEITQLQGIFRGHFEPQGKDEESLRDDFRHLVKLTSELKAIQKQAILLIGERVHQVREIFLKYGEEKGAFSAWLAYTFNSRKTAYNALAFFDLYNALPNEELKDKFKKMPAKAGYILASRSGERELKFHIIDSYAGEKQKEIIEIIEEKLPIAANDKRSPKDLAEKTLDEMERLVDVLDRRIALSRSSDKERIERMIIRLRSLIDAYS